MDKIEESGAWRRAPSQKRSQERVERMLQAATALIEEGGSDAMRMGEVAERAGVSIGSLYQYFPDKSAIVLTLAERYNAEGRACIADGLAGVRDMESLLAAFGGLIDTYYGIFLAEPVMRDIWSGTQADKALRNIDLRDSRANGALLAEAWQLVAPRADSNDIQRKAFLIMSLGEATMRLAISVERTEGDALVADYKAMALSEIGASG